MGLTAPLAAFDDSSGSLPGATLVVAPARRERATARRLFGMRFACLRTMFSGLGRRRLRPAPGRVLVTTGSGELAGLTSWIIDAVRAGAPGAEIVAVRGPRAAGEALTSVKVIDAPRSLLAPLLAADVAITTAGQTMLEAACTGIPCIALPVVANQVSGVEILAERGAVLAADPSQPEALARKVEGLLADGRKRARLSAAAQRAVDGQGAERVAARIIERL